MTPEEKFKFDLEGYLVVKQVLCPAEVEELNNLAEEAFIRRVEEKDRNRTGNVSRWGSPTRCLIDHPGILPYLLELLGPKFRIDHDYCLFMRQGTAGGNLHGGPDGGVGYEPDHWYRYRDGVMRNGLTVFTYNLTAAQSGDGGFCCIPGSHKSNFATELPRAVRRHECSAHYVVQPVVEAGDVLIFTEALIHGTMAWSAAHERRALLYKYSPGHSSWAQTYYDAEAYPEATEQQLRIMASPSVGSRPDSVTD